MKTGRTLWLIGVVLLLAPVPLTAPAQGTAHADLATSPGSTLMDRPVAIRPGYWKISQLMAALNLENGIAISRGDSVPDYRGFFASRSVPLKTLMNQLRLLLADRTWSYHWAIKSAEGSATQYELSRGRMTLAEQEQAAIQKAHARIYQIIDALPGIASGMNPNIDGDPGLGARLATPKGQAQFAFLSELSPARIDSILAGNRLDLPVAQMSPSDKSLVMKAAGNFRVATSTDSKTGATTTTFDYWEIPSHGRVVIQAAHRGPDGGPSLEFLVFSDAGEGFASGGEILYPGFPTDSPMMRRARSDVAAQTQQRIDDDLTRIIPKAPAITIDAAMPLKKDEPPFAAYLRSFAEQTGLTLLAYWPKETKDPQQRMAQSITRQPAAQALDSLCRAYHCKWVQDQKVVRIRLGGDAKQRTNPPARVGLAAR